MLRPKDKEEREGGGEEAKNFWGAAGAFRLVSSGSKLLLKRVCLTSGIVRFRAFVTAFGGWISCSV